MEHRPPLIYLRSFEAAARHLSFTLAAAELGLTQSAVSAHVRALETYLGRQLFHRAARSIALTEVGAAYLPALRHALGQIDVATAQIVRTPHRREVVVAAPASLAAAWLPGRLAAFRRLNPELGVTVHATIWSETSDRIADLRIETRHRSQPVLGTWLDAGGIVLLCPPAFVQGEGAMTGPAGVARRGLIRVLGRQDHWEDFARHHGLPADPPATGATTDSSNVALELAVAGLGCVITTRWLAEPYLARGLLVEPFPAAIAGGWGYDLHLGGLGPTRAARRLMDHLAAAAGA